MLLSICIRCRFRLYSRIPWATVVTTLSCRLFIWCNVCASRLLYSCSSGGHSVVSSTVAKYRRDAFLSPFPLPLPFCCQGDDEYCALFGFCVASVRILDCFPSAFPGLISRLRTSFESCGLGRLVISYIICQSGRKAQSNKWDVAVPRMTVRTSPAPS